MSVGATPTTPVIDKSCWVKMAQVPNDVRRSKEKRVVAAVFLEQ